MAEAVLSCNGKAKVQFQIREAGSERTNAGDMKIDHLKADGVGPRTVAVMHMLHHWLRIKVSDGRIVVGLFHCLDQHLNIILTDTREYRPPKTGSNTGEEQQAETQVLSDLSQGRHLGMTLIPGKHVVWIKRGPKL